MNDQLTLVYRAAYFHLENIRDLKPFLSQEAVVTVVHAFITSCIDYCNSLLYGISKYNLNRLQQIQNSAAYIVANASKSDHITPIPQRLHWLPVDQFIQFKVL